MLQNSKKADFGKLIFCRLLE